VLHGYTLAEVVNMRNPYVYMGKNVIRLSPDCPTARLLAGFPQCYVTVVRAVEIMLIAKTNLFSGRGSVTTSFSRFWPIAVGSPNNETLLIPVQ
jgi:hypothetical protein